MLHADLQDVLVGALDDARADRQALFAKFGIAGREQGGRSTGAAVSVIQLLDFENGGPGGVGLPGTPES